MEPPGRKNSIFRPFHRENPGLAPHRVLIDSPTGHRNAGQGQGNLLAPSLGFYLGTGRRERARRERHSPIKSVLPNFKLEINLVKGLPVIRSGDKQQEHHQKYPEPPKFHPQTPHWSRQRAQMEPQSRKIVDFRLLSRDKLLIALSSDLIRQNQ